jgi:hypothetical protein
VVSPEQVGKALVIAQVGRHMLVIAEAQSTVEEQKLEVALTAARTQEDLPILVLVVGCHSRLDTNNCKVYIGLPASFVLYSMIVCSLCDSFHFALLW